MNVIRTFIAVIATTILVGCGQRGPLYLPGEGPAQSSSEAQAKGSMPIPLPSRKKSADEPTDEKKKTDPGAPAEQAPKAEVGEKTEDRTGS